jgi:hypothetical protein
LSYRFVIGRARSDGSPDEGYVWPCQGNPDEVHRDEWDGERGPVRLPSATAWFEVTRAAPLLGAVLEEVVRSSSWPLDGPVVAPCSLYTHVLPDLEAEAATVPDWAAARELWFVRWSQEALRRYGRDAALEVSG